MTLHKSRYSKWQRTAKHPLWRWVLTPIGYLAGYLAWGLVQAAWFLMFGAWAHVTTGQHEFVPDAPKRRHWAPPLIFRGRVQKIGD